MIKLNIIEGADFSTAGNGSITRTPEGIAIGGIPDWECLFDPAYVEGGAARQRAKPATLSPSIIPVASFSSGQPAFAFNGVELADSTPIAASNANINPTAFTLFAVFQNRASGLEFNRRLFSPLSASDNASEYQLHVQLTRNTGTIGVYTSDVVGDATRVVSHTNALAYTNMTKPGVFAVTFSTENGMAIHFNGTEVARNTAFKTPLTSSAFTAGKWGFMRRNNGLAGMMGLINRDLSTTGNSGHMKNLSAFLMKKYGI